MQERCMFKQKGVYQAITHNILGFISLNVTQEA